jgi:predicted DNA-binding transcriptional regulator AlpA
MIRMNDMPTGDNSSRSGSEADCSTSSATSPEGAARNLTESPLIDVNDFAALLSCSAKHVRRMADAGRCPPPIRLGALMRWNRKVVDEWITAGCPPVRHTRIGGRR